MFSISIKVAYPIIIAGLFVMVMFIALSYQNLNTAFYITLCLLIAYIFLFGFATGQNFAKPIRRILQQAEDLSSGDVKTRIYSKDKNELGQLAQVFNKIAEQVEQIQIKNETLEKMVDIKVKAKTQALEETISALDQKVRNRTAELQKLIAEVEKYKKQPDLNQMPPPSPNPKKPNNKPNAEKWLNQDDELNNRPVA